MGFLGAFSERRKNGAGLAVLFLSLALFSCSQGKDLKGPEASNPLVLRLSSTPWPPDAINYLAQKKGFFEKHGVKVELLWADGYAEAFDQFSSGKLDVMNLTLLDAIAYHAKEDAGEAIMVQDYSYGADAVVTLSGIKSVAELKGKSVGAERGTVGEFFLKILLEREGLTLEDLNIVDTASEEILAGLKGGAIEAGICYEPCPSDVVGAGGSVIVDSAKERNLIVDIYMAKREHVEKNKEIYSNAIAAIVEAGEYFSQNPEESAQIMQESTGTSAEEILQTFKGLRVPTFAENQAAFNRSSGFSSLYNLAKLAGQYLQDQAIIGAEFDTDEVIYPELIESLTGN